MAKWFYRVMGDEFGPITTRQLVDSVVNNSIAIDTDVRRDTEAIWTSAANVNGLLEAVQTRRSELSQEEDQRKRAEGAAADRDRARWNNMRVSTCGPLSGKPCRIIDTVFAIDSSGEAGLLFDTEANPHDAFARVVEQLKRNAYSMGADAVVSCQFEYRIAVDTHKAFEALANWVGVSGGHAQCVEIFAYGTAVSYDS